jgi:putative ABC transport system permease protein
VKIQNHELEIVGVLKDFHYSSPKSAGFGEPVFLRYSDEANFLNVKVTSTDLRSALNRIDLAWRKVDNVRMLDATLYDDEIARVYNDLSMMVKVIGFLSFLTVSIATLGLFGMVVFTTESRLKEISVRKVLGASESSLLVLLSRGFLVLLIIAASIALPITYLFFDKVVLAGIAHKAPIGTIELLTGVLAVFILSMIMIGTQTIKAARSNPAEVLKTE